MGCEVCKQNKEGDGSIKITTVSQTDKVLSYIEKVKLFSQLTPEDRSSVAAACETREYAEGSVLFTEGAPGKEFFVIVQGHVSVSKGGKEIAQISIGNYFGENALLRNEPRGATIAAASAVKTLVLSRERFRKLGLNEKLDFKKRQAVGGGAERALVTHPPSSKLPEEFVTISHALKANHNLNSFCTLDDKKCKQLADVAWVEQVPAGKELIQEGDLEADYFYIVKEGLFEVSKKDDDTDHVSGVSISQGGSFGELAMMYYAPRAATVRSIVNSEVYVMDRVNFKKIICHSPNESVQHHVQYLEKVEILKSLMPDEMEEVAKALVEMDFAKDEHIFDQGEQGDAFYILYEGQVSVTKNGKEVATLRGSPAKAEIFGEVALLNGNARTATIKVLSATAKTLSLDKVSFDLMLGPLEDIQKRGKTGQSKVGKKHHHKKEHHKKEHEHSILRSDLVSIGLLGCGGFGAVELVEHNKTKETYALKALSKGYIVKCGLQRGVMSEKNIQLMCDSPFIVKLHATYNSAQSLYLLLEAALGGELYATYAKKGLHGSEKHAKYYVAGTTFAFEHLHSKKIVFRDLKSENLLLTQEGKVKLTDMGLAKVSPGKTYTTCGTPDYFAPELINASGHTFSLDWWTLGVLTFELMAGNPPFEASTPMATYSKVKHGINKVDFPPEIGSQCTDLVKKLCVKEPSERLPMKKGGTSRLKQHGWFKDFDWSDMKNLTMQPPYKPKVQNKKDIANFSAKKEDMPPQVKYKDDGSHWDKDFATSE